VNLKQAAAGPAALAIVVASVLVVAPAGSVTFSGDWAQWGQNPQHQGFVNVAGQPLNNLLDDVVYDPFTNRENTGSGIGVHYQTALDGGDVYMESKSGVFSTTKTWETQVWNEKKLSWQGGALVTQWTFASDWTPVPFSRNPDSGPTLEPVFHAALANASVYVPGAGGTVFRVDPLTGSGVRINPFGSSVDRHVFVAGPLSVDGSGNVYYNAIALHAGNPWGHDIDGAWLVKIAPDDSTVTATWASITPGTPAPTDPCTVSFSTTLLPWPPSPTAVAPTVPCLSQRPGINVAPAIAPDGTIYDLSRAQSTDRWGYLIAVNADLTSKWVASLRNHFTDGCNVELPADGTAGGCRAGAATGVDPAENQSGSGRVFDDSTASPTVAPDSSVLYGAFTRYNYAQGHLMRFDNAGLFLGSYAVGSDITPAIYPHGSTYSVVITENHFGNRGSYCDDPTSCPPRSTTNPNSETYFITQLDPALSVEWKFQNTNTQSCTRTADGSITCVPGPQHGFEWTNNAVAIDTNGDVYANSADGNLYAITQSGVLKQNIFLERAVNAAGTPLSIGADGKIYTQNFGQLIPVGS
jgi:hypothetical protein